MDDESGGDDRDELTNQWGGESRHDWWGWQNESGSWFQRRGDAYLNERDGYVGLMWLSLEFIGEANGCLQASIQKTCQDDGSRGQFCNVHKLTS